MALKCADLGHLVEGLGVHKKWVGESLAVLISLATALLHVSPSHRKTCVLI